MLYLIFLLYISILFYILIKLSWGIKQIKKIQKTLNPIIEKEVKQTIEKRKRRNNNYVLNKRNGKICSTRNLY